jgi:hypothetical protein
LSETLSTDAKILRFPTMIAEPQVAEAAPVPAGAAPSGFQRLAAVRRRRTDRTADRPARATQTEAPATQTRPSVSQLVSWLLNLRKGGVGYLYWNAAKLPIEVALVRAARLDDGAIVDIVGHRMLVVEPIRALVPSTTETPTEGLLS